MSKPLLSPVDFAGAAPFDLTFTFPGVLVVGAGQVPLSIWRPITIKNVRVRVGTAPTGASLIFDVRKNGTTVFTTTGNRPTLAAAALEDLASAPDILTAVAGDYFTADVVQIGSTIAGSNACLVVEYV